jgi:phage/plasmid-like protein (TIGR03299 family)
MAHLIEADNMVYAGDKPWHGIGTYLGVSDNAMVQAAIDAKPVLGSTMSYRPVLVADGNGGTVEIPDAFAPVRDYDNKVLPCVVGEQQRRAGASPKRLLQALQNIVGEGKAMLHTAMFLDEGKRFVATCKLGAPIEVTAPNGTKDASEFFLVAATSFDGSLRTALYETIVRVVCNNTLRASFSDRAQADRKITRIKHTQSHEAKLTTAEEQWAEAVTKYELFKRTVEILARAPLADAEALKLFKSALGVKADATDMPTRTKNNLEVIQNLYAGGMGNAPWQGTAWGALNALTEYADHGMIVRGVRDGEGKVQKVADGGEKILDSVLFGAAHDFKARALDLVSNAVGLSI